LSVAEYSQITDTGLAAWFFTLGYCHNAIEAHRRAQTAPDKENHIKSLPRLPKANYQALRGLFFVISLDISLIMPYYQL